MLSIAHLSLVVSNIERSVGFYTARLGFVEKERSANERLTLCLLSKDGLDLELICYRDDAMRHRIGSFDHLAFFSPDLESCCQGLQNDGFIDTLPELRSSPDGRRLFFTAGPDRERLEFMDRHPADLHPLEQALSERIDGYIEAWQRFEDKQNSNRIHDLRVATRRLDIITAYCQDLLKNKKLLRKQKKMRRLFSIMGRIRDCQVELDFLRNTDDALLDSRTLITALETEEENMVHKLKRRLASADPDSYTSILRKYQIRLHAAIYSRYNEAGLNKAISCRYDKYLRQLASSRSSIQPGQPRSVHRFRIAAKKVRYSVEALHSLLALPVDNVELLRILQDQAGQIQDLATLASKVEKCGGIKAGTRQLMLNLLSEQRSSLTDGLQALLGQDEYAALWATAETEAD